MAKKKTIRTHSADSARRCASRTRSERAKNFDEVACGYSLEDALREAERCLLCPDQPCIARLPGRHQHPRLHPEDRREGLPRRLRRPHRHQPAAGRSAAASARRRTSAKACARSASRWSRSPSGAWSASSATRRSPRAGSTSPTSSRTRFKVGIVGSGPGRHGLRGRHGQGRLRRHRVRGLPPAGRRAALRHPGFPPAERGDRRRDRQPRRSSASSSSATRWSAACSPSSR